jgi:hypothetical protein
MKEIVAPLNPGMQDPAVVDLQDALLFLLVQGQLETYDDRDKLIEALKGEVEL